MSVKVLFITNKISHYRLPLYEAVGQGYDLTIAHIGSAVDTEYFQQEKLTESSAGPFIQYNNLQKISDYQVVVIYANVRLLNLYRLLLKKKEYGIKFVLF